MQQSCGGGDTDSTGGSWKTRITSTMRTNSRMNALLSDTMSLHTLVGKRKNLSRLKEAMKLEAGQTASAASSTNNRLVTAESKLPGGAHYLPPIAPKERPNFERIRLLLEETVAEQLGEEKFFRTYNSEISAKFCQILAREMRTKIKLLHLERYRVVCVATIIEKQQQSVDYKLNYLMDSGADNYTTYLFEGATYFIVATAVLVYTD